MGCAHIKGCFGQTNIIPLQASYEHQHTVGRNECCLTQHGQKNTVLQKTVRTQAQHYIDPIPKYQGGNTQHDAWYQNWSNDDRIKSGANFRPNLSQNQRTGQADRDRQNDRKKSDNQAIPQPGDNALVVEQDAKRSEERRVGKECRL